MRSKKVEVGGRDSAGAPREGSVRLRRNQGTTHPSCDV